QVNDKVLYVLSADVQRCLCHRSAVTEILRTGTHEAVYRENQIPFLTTWELGNPVRIPRSTGLLSHEVYKRANTVGRHFINANQIRIEVGDPGRSPVPVCNAVCSLTELHVPTHHLDLCRRRR